MVAICMVPTRTVSVLVAVPTIRVTVGPARPGMCVSSPHPAPVHMLAIPVHMVVLRPTQSQHTVSVLVAEPLVSTTVMAPTVTSVTTAPVPVVAQALLPVHRVTIALVQDSASLTVLLAVKTTARGRDGVMGTTAIPVISAVS